MDTERTWEVKEIVLGDVIAGYILWDGIECYDRVLYKDFQSAGAKLRTITPIPFENVKHGEKFERGYTDFIKIQEIMIAGGKINAIELRSDEPNNWVYFDSFCEVRLV